MYCGWSMIRAKGSAMRCVLFVVLIGFTASRALAGSIGFEDVVVLTVPHGHGLGRVVVNCNAGGCDRPTCFWIDPNGLFYVPEIDSTNKGWKDIRIHKFRPDGTAIEVVNLEGITSFISSMRTSSNGDIFLVETVIGLAERYVGHYDKNGRLINRFGPNGEITKADFNDITYAKERKELVRRKCFTSDAPRLVGGGKKDTLYAAQNLFNEHKPNTYLFNTKSAMLLERVLKNDNLPQEVLGYRNTLAERLSLKSRIDDEDAVLRMRSAYIGIIGPDGAYYYLQNHFRPPKRMEIHRLTFEQ